MTIGGEKTNPYSPPAHVSVASGSRKLRPDEREYLSSLLAFRRTMPPVSSALYALIAQSLWPAVGAGIGATAVGTATGILLELTPGQLLSILFVLFFCIQSVIVYHRVSAMQSSCALWEVASRVHDLSAVERLLETGQLPLQEHEPSTTIRGGDGSVAS